LSIEKEKDMYEYFYALSRTGMRPNEFRALQAKDLQGNYLVVNKNITSKIAGAGDIIQTPKNKASNRKVLIPDEVAQMLSERIKGYKPNDFIFGKEKAFRETNLNRSLAIHIKIVELKPIVLYGFRHSHATNLIRAGVPIKVVSRRLGHKDASTTMNVYWHLFSEDEELALKVIK
jgi:integrase